MGQSLDLAIRYEASYEGVNVQFMDSSMQHPADEPGHYNDLSQILDEAWRLLADGVSNRHALSHTPVLASVGRDGRANARVVVLP